MIRCARAAILAGAAVGCLATGGVGADPVVRTSATATASVGYERNPFLIDTPRNTGAASAQVEIRPTVTITDVRSNAQIQAFYNRTQYFSKYDGNDNAGVLGSASFQLSPRLNVSTQAGFTTGIIGSNNGLGLIQNAVSTITPAPGTTPVTGDGATVPVTGVGPGVGGVITDGSVGVILPGGDVGLVGLRQRRNSLTASGGLTYQPSALSTFSASVFSERSTYPGRRVFAQDYTTYGGSLGYNRRLSESTSVGLRGTATFADYDTQGKSTFYSPQLTFTRRLSPRLTFDLAVGASFVENSGALIQRRRSTIVSGQASLCRADELTSYCLTASRAPGVNGFAGTNTSTLIGASYTRRLSELSTISAAANYSRIETNARLANVPVQFGFGNQEFWSVSGSYAYRLSRRLSAVATGQYRDATYTNFSPRADISGRLGISVALGDLQ